MAQFTITIPDNLVAEVVDALALLWGYVDNPEETKPQFVKRQIEEHLKLSYRRGKRLFYENDFITPADPGLVVE